MYPSAHSYLSLSPLLCIINYGLPFLFPLFLVIIFFHPMPTFFRFFFWDVRDTTFPLAPGAYTTRRSTSTARFQALRTSSPVPHSPLNSYDHYSIYHPQSPVPIAPLNDLFLSSFFLGPCICIVSVASLTDFHDLLRPPSSPQSNLLYNPYLHSTFFIRVVLLHYWAFFLIRLVLSVGVECVQYCIMALVYIFLGGFLCIGSFFFETMYKYILQYTVYSYILK